MGGGAAAPQHPGHWHVEALHSSAHGRAEEDAQDSGKGQVFGGSHRASSKAWMIPAQDGIPSCNTGRRTSVRQHRSQRRNAWLTGGSGHSLTRERLGPHPEELEVRPGGVSVGGDTVRSKG